MKKLKIFQITIYVIALGFLTANADNNFILITHNDPVWIYPYATSTAPKRVIQMVDERNVYAFKVIDDSLTRFKIQIYEPNIYRRILDKNGTELYMQDNNAPPILILLNGL